MQKPLYKKLIIIFFETYNFFFLFLIINFIINIIRNTSIYNRKLVFIVQNRKKIQGRKLFLKKFISRKMITLIHGF